MKTWTGMVSSISQEEEMNYFEVLDVHTGRSFMGSRVQCLSFIEGWRYKIFRKENNKYWVW